MIFIKPRIYGLAFVDVGLLIFILETRELKKQAKFNALGMRTPAQIRTIHIEDFIRKHISTNGKALGKKEWKAIKKEKVSFLRALDKEESSEDQADE